jgi:hypothetical protein
MMRSVLLLVCCWGLPSLASSFLPPLPSSALEVTGVRRAVTMPTQRASAGKPTFDIKYVYLYI